MSCRLVHFVGPPGFFPAGSNGSSIRHSRSVRSPRAPAGTLPTRSPDRWCCLVALHLPETSHVHGLDAPDQDEPARAFMKQALDELHGPEAACASLPVPGSPR